MAYIVLVFKFYINIWHPNVGIQVELRLGLGFGFELRLELGSGLESVVICNAIH